MARYGLGAWAAAVDDLGESHRLAILLFTAHELEAVIQDEVLDLLLLNVAQKFNDAEKAGLKARLKALARVDAATLRSSAACQFVLNEKLPGPEVRQAIFKEIPREDQEKAVALVNQETSIHAPLYYNLLTDGHRSLCLFLPAHLQTITFRATNASDDILSAWQFLYQLDHVRPRPDLQTAPQEVVKNSAWRAVVYDQEKQVDKRYYTFRVLQMLIVALERRDVFISPSRRWQDQRAQLLQGDAWKKAHPQICAALGKTADGDLMPELDLPDLLLEVHRLTGFADEFVHISEKQARASDLPLSICAVLLAEACNVGLDDVVNPSIPALQRSRLLWVQQNYIRDETLTHANARLVAAQAEIPLAQQWGVGHVASADGQRFNVLIESLMAAQDYKYFGEERGITYFTFTSDQFSSFFGIVIPGAVRKALYILDGLLEQQTVLEPVEIMTEAAGYTDIVFGLFWLLGYQFSPRLRDIGKTCFWRFDKKARYGALGRVARHRLNEGRMIDNWDDLLPVAGSMKLGMVTASGFMKTLQAGKGSSELAKAISEIGRAAKTLYLLNYIDDADYRRRILIQLNHGE